MLDAFFGELSDRDFIFVANRKYYVTPLFYYVDQSRVVSTKYEAALANRAQARVWVVAFHSEQHTDELWQALKHFRPAEEVSALGVRAILYRRE